MYSNLNHMDVERDTTNTTVVVVQLEVKNIVVGKVVWKSSGTSLFDGTTLF